MTIKKRNNDSHNGSTNGESHGDLLCGWVLFYDEGNNTSFGSSPPLLPPPSSPSPDHKTTNGTNAFSYRSFGEFNTIMRFWQYWNYLEKRYLEIDPNKYFNMRIFRQGIRPLWEDPQNIHGGKFVLRILKKDREFLWRELTLALIGRLSSEDFTGIVLQSKPAQFDVVQLWSGKQLGEKEIGLWQKELQKMCNERHATVTYVPHENTRTIYETMTTKAKERFRHLKTESMLHMKGPASPTKTPARAKQSKDFNKQAVSDSKSKNTHASTESTPSVYYALLKSNGSMPAHRFSSLLGGASQSMPSSPVGSAKESSVNDEDMSSFSLAIEDPPPITNSDTQEHSNGNAPEQNTSKSKRQTLSHGPTRRRASSSADEVMLNIVPGSRGRSNSKANRTQIHDTSKPEKETTPVTPSETNRDAMASVSSSKRNDGTSKGSKRSRSRKETSHRSKKKDPARQNSKLEEIKRRNALFVRISILVGVLVLAIAFIVIHRQQAERR